MRPRFAFALPLDDAAYNLLGLQDARSNRIPSVGEDLGRYWATLTYELTQRFGGS